MADTARQGRDNEHQAPAYMTVEEFAALPSDVQHAVWGAFVDSIPAVAKVPNGVRRYDRAQVQAIARELEAPKRMAVDPDGKVRPVGEFSRAEKWWCDGEDCGGLDDPDLPVPHVHCEMHVHPVDLLTGQSTDGGHRG